MGFEDLLICIVTEEISELDKNGAIADGLDETGQ